MYKPVRLQGWGEGSLIDAVKAPPEALQVWRDKVQSLLDDLQYTLVPGQEAGTFVGVEPILLFNEEARACSCSARTAAATWARRSTA